MFVKQWMATGVISIAPNQTIAEAKKLLQAHRIRRLPVVEAGALVGMVSRNDLGKVMPSILDAQADNEEEFIADHTEVRTVMTSSPITIGSEDTLFQAARTMRRHTIDGLPVVGDGKLVGILSISDILDAFLDIMDLEVAGTRFDLKIDHAPESFYALIKIFQRQQKEIVAISQFHHYSKDQQMVSIQIRGDDHEELVEKLWAGNVTVDRITPIP